MVENLWDAQKIVQREKEKMERESPSPKKFRRNQHALTKLKYIGYQNSKNTRGGSYSQNPNNLTTELPQNLTTEI